jgi:hypothetical protein
VIIDEAQRRQDLFPVLRVPVDEDDRPGRFLVLGSASPDLVGLASESLAGRVALVELGGFRLLDVGADAIDRLWVHGGLPRSYLAGTGAASARCRDDFISTFLERDLANLGVRISRHHPAPLLDDGRPVPRPDLDRRRTGPGPRRVGEHRAPVPRQPDQRPGDPPAPTVVRQHLEAAGPFAEGLCARQRAAAPAPGNHGPERPPEPSQGRRQSGRLRHRTAPHA